MCELSTANIVVRHSGKAWRLTPYQILSLGFAALIFLGTLLLMLPAATEAAESGGLSFVDALFTATSAVCVTGLSVVDVGRELSLFGQVVVIALVQIGAFGFMTLTTLLAVFMRRRVQLKDRLVIQEELNQITFSGIVQLLLYILRATLFIEFIGGTLLALRFWPQFGPTGIYFGYWHAVSAFCNAGFDVFSAAESTMYAYASDWLVNAVMTALVVLGGLGFYVLVDLRRGERFKRYSLQTKVVLTTTAALSAVGMLGMFLLEYQNPQTMGPLTFSGKLCASFFQGVASRTAGLSTVPTGDLTDASLFFLCILMFIGASPGSTGGGIKTTTFAVIVAAIWGLIRGHNDTTLFYRRISPPAVYKAFAILFTSAVLTVTITMLLSITENFSFIQILFEVVSAFSTAGMSTGITGELTNHGKLCLIPTMFIGRVGPVTFALALALKHKKRVIQYPEGKITIG